jgi:hypothetical protein
MTAMSALANTTCDHASSAPLPCFFDRVLGMHGFYYFDYYFVSSTKYTPRQSQCLETLVSMCRTVPFVGTHTYTALHHTTPTLPDTQTTSHYIILLTLMQQPFWPISQAVSLNTGSITVVTNTGSLTVAASLQTPHPLDQWHVGRKPLWSWHTRMQKTLQGSAQGGWT